MEEVKTKKCTKCGTEKPLTEFGVSKYSVDGRKSTCKECANEYAAEYYQRKKAKEKASHLIKVYLNPEFAKFQPKDLISELRARGYSGELTFKQVIKV